MTATTANTASQADANTETIEVEPLPQAAPRVSKRPKNALTHGIYAEELVLAWENPGDLVTLRNNLWAELQPEGRLEEETVLGIVHDVWLKHRLMRTVNLSYRLDPFDAESTRASAKDWDDLMNLVTSDADNKGHLADALKESLDVLKKAAEKISDINVDIYKSNSLNALPKETVDGLQDAIRDAAFVRKYFHEQVFSRMIALETAHKSKAATIIEKAYSPEHLEKALRLEAMLDTRIDKQMGRLASLKQYKRLRSALPKEVSNSPSILVSQPVDIQSDVTTDTGKSNVKTAPSK